MVSDMSSDIFSRVIDYSKFDLIYAGAQKIVKEQEVCKCCGIVTKFAESERFCDQCGQKIEAMGELILKVYSYDFVAPEVFEFCCWSCVRCWLSDNKEKIELSKSMKLPYVACGKNTIDFYMDFLLMWDLRGRKE